ncbi:MAG: hypothetical protein ACFCGT_20290 [Sandaracinaceae bacterium]
MVRLGTRDAALVLALAVLPPGADAQDPRLPADPMAAPSPEAARILAAVPDEDGQPVEEHYPVSNEWRHDLLFPDVRGLGGAFVGIGTDQCYTLAAVQRARVLWVVDHDPVVPLIHRIYGIFLENAERPEQLLARFEAGERAASEALLEAARRPGEVHLRLVYRTFRPRLHHYLTRVARRRIGGRPTTWLSDPTLFAWVRNLHRTGRVIARTGDLTADGTVRAIGEAARALRVPVRVLYLSNAEQFFAYGPAFRRNLAALPLDERSVVLRTFRHARVPYPPGDRWHYLVQPLHDFRGRVLDGGYRHSRQLIYDLLADPRRIGEDGVSRLDGAVPRAALEERALRGSAGSRLR